MNSLNEARFNPLMRLSRILADQPAWSKFFGTDVQIKTDYVRAMKEILELNNKVVPMIVEASARDFSDFNDLDMLAVLARYNLVVSQMKRFSRNETFIAPLMLKLHHKIEVENDVEWTPRKLDFFFNYYHNTSATFFELYSRETLNSVLDTALEMIDKFNIIELGSMVRCICHFPRYYEAFYAKLLRTFNARKDFSLLSSPQLAMLAKSLFVRYDSSGNKFPVLAAVLDPESYNAFEVEAIRRIRKELWISNTYVPISESIANLTPRPQNYSNFLVELLTDVADVESNTVDEKLTECFVLPPLKLMNAVDPKHPLYQSLLEKVTAVLFVKHVFQKSAAWAAMTHKLRVTFFVSYLTMAASRDLFQVAFLDLTVQNLVSLINKKAWLSLKQISQVFASLAHLNYHGRFNISLPFLPKQWEDWQALLGEGSSLVRRSLFNAGLSPELPQENEDLMKSRHLIDYLWAQCVCERFDPELFPKVSPMINVKDLNEESVIRLMQLHNYLTYEKASQCMLSVETQEFLRNYKAKWDAMRSPLVGGELHNAIKMTLEASGTEITEFVRDFPYTIDIVYTGTRRAIQVEDIDSYMEGSEIQLKSGSMRLESRQLAFMGWQVKRHSYKTWVMSGHIQMGIDSSTAI